MRIEYQRYKLLTRRGLLLGMGKIGLMGILAARMYYLQVIESEKYKTLSIKNHIRLIPIPPIRGIIYDRNQNILALNKNNYRAILIKENKSHLETIKNKLINLLELSEKEIEEFEHKTKIQEKHKNITLFDNISWRNLSIIEVNILDLPGVFIEIGQIRYYPFHNICAHLIGYVGTVSKDEITNNSLIYHPDYKIGKNGVEKLYDSKLQGTPGYKQIEVDAYGHVVREIEHSQSIPGDNINLSLNIKLQDLVYNMAEGHNMAAIVMDIKNGEILAMCSSPSFDPNRFTKGVSEEYWNKIINNENLPLLNKTISQQYPPGSVFKLVTSLAAVEAGINPETKIYCNGVFNLGNHKFHCWKHDGHGFLNMPQAIQKSCNVYIYHIARKIGFEKISEIAIKLGLGNKFNIGLIGEIPGIIPNRAWKKSRFKKDWNSGDTINCSIGHGYVNTNMLQLAVMTARIATGKKVIPILEKQEKDIEFPDLEISDEALKTIRTGMYMAVNKPSGTVFKHRNLEQKYLFAAKTGTGQVVSIKRDSKGLAIKSNNAKNKTHHGLCVGYAPFNNPRFSCAVIVEHGGSGASAAAPILKEALSKAMEFNET